MILLPYLRCVHLLIVVLILSACGSGRSGRFVGDDAYPTPTSDMPKIAARVMAPYDLSGWRFSVPIPGGGWSQRSDSFLAFARARSDGWSFARFEVRGESLQILPLTIDAAWNAWLDRQMMCLIATLAHERTTNRLRPTGHASDHTPPVGLFVESPDRACALLLPQEIPDSQRGEAMSLYAFFYRIDQAIQAAADGSIGVSASEADDVGRITAKNAPLSVRIGQPVICNREAARTSSETGVKCEGQEEDATSKEWLNPAPLALSDGVVRQVTGLNGGRSIDAALWEIRDRWALSSRDEDERRIATWRIVRRFDPRGDPGFVQFIEWPLVFSLQRSAAQGYDWPLEVAAYLHRTDPGTQEGRILYQWLCHVEAWYHRDHPQQVEALMTSMLRSREYVRRTSAAKMLAHLLGPRAIPLLREIRGMLGDPGHQLLHALVHAGAEDELVPLYRATLPGDSVYLKIRLLYFCKTIGMVPSKAYAEAGFPGLPLADRRALAQAIPTLVASGQVSMLLSSLPVDDPDLAHWLVESHRSGQSKAWSRRVDDFKVQTYTRGVQVELLGLLARQSGREGVSYLAELCRAGDEDARLACAQHWNPKFFPDAPEQSDHHVAWTMDDQAIATADWDAVIAAAVAGRLVKFAVGTPDF